MYLKVADELQNTVDPDQTPRSVVSDPDLHRLIKPVPKIEFDFFTFEKVQKDM